MKYIVIAVITTSLSCVGISAEAILLANGTSLNGTSLNGTSLNGTSFNGTSLNRINFSGSHIGLDFSRIGQAALAKH